MLGRIALALTLVVSAAGQARLREPGLPALFERTFQAGPIQLTVPTQEIQGSPFSPDAGLSFLLRYPALGLELKARGLYFRPGPGGVPEPVLEPERLRVEVAGLDALASRELKRLGDALPDLGLPLRIKEPRFEGFEGAKAGCVSFRIALELGGPLGIEPANLLALEAGVTVHSTGKVELAGPLEVAVDRPLPLGASGLVLDGVSLELRPGDRDETVRLTTHIAPAVGGKQGLSLDVTVTFGLPLRQVRFQGRLLLARREPLGRVEGTLSHNEVKGRLLIPDPRGTARGLGELLGADLLFDMTREGILAEGSATLFGGVGGRVNLVLPFSGQGLLMASESWRLLGLAAPASVTVHFAPGFRNLELDADLNVEVDLEVLKVMVSLSIHAVSQPRPEVEVAARVFGVTVRFRLDHLGQLTAARLREELKKKLTDFYDNLVHALADLEKEGGELLTQAEESLRGAVCSSFHRAGLERACCGCKERDERLAELASGRKNLIGWGVKSRCKAQKWLAQAPPGHPLLAVLQTVGKELVRLLDPAGKKCRQEQAEREQRVDTRLAALVEAINSGAVNRVLAAHIDCACQAGHSCCKDEAHRPRTVTRLHLSCGHAVSAAVQDGGTLGFVITTSGFQCCIDPAKMGRCPRRHGSDVQAGVVRFLGLLDQTRRPRAQIVLPELDHGSCLPAREYLHDALAELIERLLPEVEIEGRQLERELAVRNGTAEPVHFVVQVLARSPATGLWSWQPGGEEQAPQGYYSFDLPPGETVALTVEKVRLAGVAAHFRAWSASGVVWSKYAQQPLWLVGEKDTFGRRRYQARERATFLFNLEPDESEPTGP